MYVPSQSQIDLSSIYVESQLPTNLQIEISQPSSPTHSMNVDMIQTFKTDSPSPKLMEEIYSQTGDHHQLDDLLDHHSIIFDTLVESVSQNSKTISHIIFGFYFKCYLFAFLNGYLLAVDKCLLLTAMPKNS